MTAGATVVVLALGGTVAYAATSGDSARDAVTGAAASASPSPGGPCDWHDHGMWLGLIGDAVHGEATVKDRDTGKWVERILQRGTVQKVDGDKVTVKSEDGTSWTWTVGSDTTVYGNGTSGSGADELKKGETAWLVGTRSDDGTRTAMLAVSGTAQDMGPGDWQGAFLG
ncbi:hypothetical protein ACFOZ0_15670 [Streptomyces yaanensis]|uniref:DUF5666 domain-containing protein n=1 Tax=Streptomyces yaanensis TaxID=1142239 RepID=A0ABV7SEC3_9ACTN|nr:hypothetical protein [Streptomyces sp. CGMCC 4.7035]WNB98493.1 hypothetical protein Q2K21_10630 [Streptomyces sp. CGMCC 4.7035]